MWLTVEYISLSNCALTTTSGWWSWFYCSAYISTLPSFSSSSFLVTQQHPVWVQQGSVHLFLQSPNPRHQAGFVLQLLLFHSGHRKMNVLTRGEIPSISCYCHRADCKAQTRYWTSPSKLSWYSSSLLYRKFRVWSPDWTNIQGLKVTEKNALHF